MSNVYGALPKSTNPLKSMFFEAALKKKQLREGLDPLVAKKQAEYASIHTVDELFADWHEGNVRRLKHHQIPQRVYTQDIAPVIGEMQPSDITGRDSKQILQNIVESNRPTIANDALLYYKQLFNHAIKLDIIVYNPLLLSLWIKTP